MPDSPTFRHLKKMLVVAVKGKPSARPNCWWWKVIHPARPQTAADGVILAICMILKTHMTYVNAGMPE
jgi:hypothetical protein